MHISKCISNLLRDRWLGSQVFLGVLCDFVSIEICDNGILDFSIIKNVDLLLEDLCFGVLLAMLGF